MTSVSDLATIRRAYARQIMQAAHVDDPRLEAAFADVPREAFLGPGPWALVQIPGGHKTTPDTDPIVLYQDAPVSILADKRLNNGQPSFVAMLIGLCAIREGDRVVHIGTGTGYYTAMISRLAGLSGGVLGIEYETELARRAARNLEGYPNTAIVCGDGWTHPLEPTDAILVNAGTPRPAQVWLDALKPGGRLILPLTVRHDDHGKPMTRGVIFLVRRDADGFAAACKSGTWIYPCWGGSDPGPNPPS